MRFAIVNGDRNLSEEEKVKLMNRLVGKERSADGYINYRTNVPSGLAKWVELLRSDKVV